MNLGVHIIEILVEQERSVSNREQAAKNRGKKYREIPYGGPLCQPLPVEASGAIADLDALLRSQAEPTNGPLPAAPSWALRCPVGRSPATPEYSKEDKREEQRSKNTSQNISKIKRRKQSSKLGKHKIGPTVAPRRVILSPPGIQGWRLSMMFLIVGGVGHFGPLKRFPPPPAWIFAYPPCRTVPLRLHIHENFALQAGTTATF